MKKIALILLLICPLAAKSQWTLRPSVEYDYAHICRHNVAIGALADYQLHETTSVGMGLQLRSQDRYAFDFNLSTRLLHMRYGSLFLENRYLYRLFPRYDIQEFTALLSLAYVGSHVNTQVGLFNRYYGTIPLRKHGGSSTIFEPMNIAFAAEIFLFEPSHPWNLSARGSNFRDFYIERFTSFFYSLRGRYELTSAITLTAELGLQVSGPFNLAAAPHECYLNLGMTYTFKN